MQEDTKKLLDDLNKLQNMDSAEYSDQASKLIELYYVNRVNPLMELLGKAAEHLSTTQKIFNELNKLGKLPSKLTISKP